MLNPIPNMSNYGPSDCRFVNPIFFSKIRICNAAFSVSSPHLFNIIRRKFVSVRSKFFGAVNTVFMICGKKQMIWINTWWVITFVTDAKAFWNRTIDQLPADSVSKPFSFFIKFLRYANKSVTLGASAGSPNPATFPLFYFLPESLREWLFSWGMLSFINTCWHKKFSTNQTPRKKR